MPTVDVIREFRGEHRFLSNFYTDPAGEPLVVGAVNGHWPHPHRHEFRGASVEHTFQACKVEWNNRPTVEVAQEMTWILDQPTPSAAKQAGSSRGKDGRKIVLRADWEEVKVLVMLRILRAKFASPDLAVKLIQTSPSVLVEGNGWGDREWGATLPDLEGKNLLGRLLMLVRAELLVATVAGVDVGLLRAG